MKSNSLIIGVLLTSVLSAIASTAPHINIGLTYRQSLAGTPDGTVSNNLVSVTTGAVFKFDISVPFKVDADVDGSTTLDLSVFGFYDNVSAPYHWEHRSLILGRDLQFTRGKTSALITGPDEQFSINWSTTSLTITGYTTSLYLPISDPNNPTPNMLTSEEGPYSGLGMVEIGFGDRIYQHTINTVGTNHIKTGDAYGAPFPLLKGSATITADMMPPVIKVTSPSQSFVTTNDVFTATVAVVDNTALQPIPNMGVFRVFALTDYPHGFSLNISQPDPRHATSTFDIDELSCGTNIFSVEALDTAGNSVQTNFVVFRSCQVPVTLAINGPGRIQGVTNGQPVIIGRSYTVTATNNMDKIFAGWYDPVGNLLTTSRTYSFVMSNGLSLTANFIDNPFRATAGTYYGTFSFDMPDILTSGAMNLALTSSGTFTAYFRTAVDRASVVGQFTATADGTSAYFPVVISHHTNWVTLNLGTDPLNSDYQTINGNIFFPDYFSEAIISGGKSILNGYNLFSGPGRYNFAFPSGLPDFGLPSGDGFGTVTVATNGTLTGSLNVPDDLAGTGIPQTLQLSGSATIDGTFYIFAPLYSKQGYIIGSLKFDNIGSINNSSNVTSFGTLTWSSPSTSWYGGTVTGSKWAAIAPKKYSGTVDYGGGMLDEKIKTIEVSSAGALTVTDPVGNEDNLSGKIDFSTGTYTLKFGAPDGQTFNGMIAGWDDSGNLEGHGFFLRGGTSGVANLTLSPE